MNLQEWSAKLRTPKYVFGLLVAITIAALALVPGLGRAPNAHDFLESVCDFSTGAVVFIQFNDGDRSRRIVFNDRGHSSDVALARGPAIAVDWDRILGIRIAPNGANLQMFEVEFDPRTKISPARFQFGLITPECAGKLRARYSRDFAFKDK